MKLKFNTVHLATGIKAALYKLANFLRKPDSHLEAQVKQMKFWQIIYSIFNFRPPALISKGGSSLKGGSPKKELSNPDDLPLFSSVSSELDTNEKSTLEKIWIDNTFRVWISNLTFVLCWILWFTGSIPQFKPLALIFVLYILLEFSATWLLLKTNWHRQIDIVLCTVDVIGISTGVYFTGGSGSPLFFLYFIPIIIQAFHRDWALILFYGFGGVLGYSASIFFRFEVLARPDLINLGSRIFFMAITVSTAILAVTLLRRQIRTEGTRLSRMRMLTMVSQILNRTTSLREIPESIRDIVGILNTEFCGSIRGWARAFLLEETGHTMKSLTNTQNQRLDLKQELPAVVCPVMKNHKPFSLENVEKDQSCPSESFSFSSHLCIPISGAGNETFGVLFCGSDLVGAFKTQEREFLEFISRAIGLTLQRLRRVEELQLSLEMDSCAMATYIASTKGLDQTYHAILDGVKTILKTDQASLMVWNAQSGKLTSKAIIGRFQKEEKGWTFAMGEGIPGRVLESAKMIRTLEAQKESPYSFAGFPFKSLICLPLHTFKGEPIGVINAWHSEKGDGISNYEIDIASTFITRAILAIENAFLHKNEKKKTFESGEGEKAA